MATAAMGSAETRCRCGLYSGRCLRCVPVSIDEAFAMQPPAARRAMPSRQDVRTVFVPEPERLTLPPLTEDLKRSAVAVAVVLGCALSVLWAGWLFSLLMGFLSDKAIAWGWV